MIGAANVPGASEAEVKAAAQEISDKVGTTGDIGGSAIAGTVMGKLNKLISDLATHMGRWSAARAGYIDTIKTDVSEIKESTAENNTENADGTLSQKLTHIINLLTSGNVNEKLDEIVSQMQNISAIKSIQRGIAIADGKESQIDISINTVDPSKCMVILKGGYGAGSSMPSSVMDAIAYEINPNKLSMQFVVKPSGSILRACNVSWQVIEFN